MKMPVTEYRALRVWSILGNPTAYQIVKLLMGKKLTSSEIARDLVISESLVSVTLRVHRNVDVVRYETNCREEIYLIKDELIPQFCSSLEKFVIAMRKKRW
ncbi:MAG: ArsR family transcriptional regulator [candidate division WOR-3 bacterium]|nr:ArsR family transcriptional regulator [candidate division WOR-3 bacterium]